MGWLDETISAYTDPKKAIPAAGIGAIGAPLMGYTANQNNMADANNASIAGSVAANSGAGPRQADFERGMSTGKDIFYNDPNMQSMLAKRQDLAQGYNGQELGSLRNQSRGDLEGQRSKYLQQMHSNAAKGGVGGARAAAMEGAADANFAGKRATNENQMNMDQAKMVRQGTGDLQDFMMRQKYGQLGTAMGEEQFGVADRTAANQAAIAQQQPKKGIVGQFFDGIF